ncbi:Rap family tetratricopeptide repeat protein [Halalkalibacterium halodurans]|uniref:Rap family tetratricopeptide repeat protein n=1 Tax=Halalkalibacterium halodurans TaxID=86665 RepID=UPI002AA9AC22|nr:Rap family tetratricopeptide repeat protein [Halalkalibacterium halodurans]MDY7220674.1 Rap family tetratricopeptide repeat protein [Halalkalibacterium halodurans]MDY7239913.1 Rap family tetratricopeptide repeat protein [Halalkalibacterium halodurans]
MVGKLASTEVANRLNEWYDTIKRHEIEEATRLKSEVQQAIEEMEEDQNVLLYYNLIDSRYKQLIEQFDESKNILESVKEQTEHTETDQLLKYYYYFFCGLYEFYKRNYIKSIHSYRQAEKFLDDIPDEIEHAEFHFQLANAYYGIDQHFFSLSHAEKAMNMYKKHDNYVNRYASAIMTIAANRFELNRHEAAISLHRKAIELAVENGHTFLEIVGHYNLGVCYEYLNKLQFAKDSFETALDIDYPQEQKKDTFLEIKYMLARVLFKMDQLEEANKWLNMSRALAEEINEETYKTKLSILHYIYLEPSELLLDKEIESLEKRNLWHDVSDSMANAARHFKKKEMYKLATKYFSDALQAKEKITSLQEEAERA